MLLRSLVEAAARRATAGAAPCVTAAVRFDALQHCCFGAERAGLTGWLCGLGVAAARPGGIDERGVIADRYPSLNAGEVFAEEERR